MDGTSTTVREEGVVTPLRVVVGEDSFLVREGIVGSLAQDPRVEVVAAEADPSAISAAIERLQPDVVITDIRMPPTKTDEGIRLAQELATTHPALGVVVLSEFAQIAYATALFSAGSGRRAYLLKDRIAETEVLVEAIEAVSRGTPMLDSSIVGLIVDASGPRSNGLERLTPREKEVLELVAEGRSNAAIAAELVLTRRAVERHINSIFSKLRLDDTEHVNRRVLAALLWARSHDA
jgi:DNA-binding NarL/FixJ family response regulator